MRETEDRVGLLKSAVKKVISKMGMMDMSHLTRSSYIAENLPAVQKHDQMRDQLTVQNDSSAFHYKLSDVSGQERGSRNDTTVDLVPVS